MNDYSKHTHDSKAESRASSIFSRLGAIPCNTQFDAIFVDKRDEEFRARPDFYHPQSGVFIEYKPCTLNSVTSKSASRNKLAAQARYRGGQPTKFDQLRYGWNQSKVKQAIVQAKLTPQNFIVVFDKKPVFSDAKAYAQKGVTFCTLNSLPSYLAYAHFRKLGLPVSFTLPYDEECGALTID